MRKILCIVLTFIIITIINIKILIQKNCQKKEDYFNFLTFPLLLISLSFLSSTLLISNSIIESHIL